MNSPRLVFCERRGDWALAWRRIGRQYTPPWPSAVETRSLDECHAAVCQSGAALAAIELLPGESIDPLANFLASAELALPQLRSVGLLLRGDAAWEAAVRELGLIHVVVGYGELHQLMSLVRRQSVAAATTTTTKTTSTV